MMFTMDMPTVPMQETPMVLAQAAAPSAGATPQPDYILNACKETESTGDPRSAMRAVDPSYMLKNYLYSSTNGKIIANLASIKSTLLQGTKHGNLLSSVSNTGRTTYHYDPTPDYIGNDRAVFLAQFEGKVYKVVVDIKVLMVIDDNSPQCDPPRLIRVNKPSSGASGFGAGYSLGSISVTFAGLSGSAISHSTP